MDQSETTPSNGVQTEAERRAAELAALRAQIAAEDTAREKAAKSREPDELATARAELELSRRRRQDEETIADLERLHGKLNEGIASLDTPEGMIVVKCPDYITFKRYNAAAKASRATLEEDELLVLTCLLHPARDRYIAIRDKRAGIVTTLSTLALRLAGVRQVDLEGK